MSDLVERLREAAEQWAELKDAENAGLCKEAADALEAAQAKIEAVRRETVEECVAVAEERTKDRMTLYSDRSREPHEIKALEAEHIAAVIRFLTEAKEEK